MFSGVFKKMISIHDDPVRYILDFGNDLLFLNQSIGKNFKIHKTGIVAFHVKIILKYLQMDFVKSVFLSHQCLVIGL